MRLTGRIREVARLDLIEQLERRGPLTTGQLTGTQRFHGARTLSWRQIRTLLRETGRVVEEFVGHGMYTSTLWSLKPEPTPEVAP